MKACLFTHDDSWQVWVFGTVDTSLKIIRLDIIREKNANNLSIFVYNNFREGNI